MDKAKLLNRFSQLLNEIEHLEQTASGFYDFEKGSVDLLTEMNREIVESAVGKAPGDYRKKKCKCYYGELELDNRHRFILEIKGIKMSAFLQDIAAYVGRVNATNQVLN